MSPYPLTHFEIQECYQNEQRFKDVYSRICLIKIKDEAYEINVGEYVSIATHRISLCLNSNN